MYNVIQYNATHKYSEDFFVLTEKASSISKGKIASHSIKYKEKGPLFLISLKTGQVKLAKNFTL